MTVKEYRIHISFSSGGEGRGVTLEECVELHPCMMPSKSSCVFGCRGTLVELA